MVAYNSWPIVAMQAHKAQAKDAKLQELRQQFLKRRNALPTHTDSELDGKTSVDLECSVVQLLLIPSVYVDVECLGSLISVYPLKTACILFSD